MKRSKALLRIKKYPQSHLVIINEQGSKLIIDPGYLTFEKGFKVEDFQGADGYLITHIHRDHVDSNTIKEVVGENPVYGNSDVYAALGHFFNRGINVQLIKDKEKFKIKEFEIQAFDLSHFPLGPGKPGPHNTGFLVNEVFFHPGDGIKLDGLTSESAAIPIAHPSITLEDAVDFAKSLQAKIVIPIHYDIYSADLAEFSKLAEKENLKVMTLGFGEETEV